MTEYKTEEEQVEDLKRWFKENSKSLITTVIVVIVAVSGFKYWQNEQLNKTVAASQTYDAMLDDLSKNKLDDATIKGEALLGQFPDSQYANQASLLMAKMAIEKGDVAKAKAHLNRVVDKSEQNTLKNLASIRLARILVGEGAADDALTVLGKISEVENFKAQYEELLGDIHAAKGEKQQAKEAYGRSLEAATVGERSNLIRMKIDQLSLDDKQTG